ncbi:MAG: response regulator transcription factor [Aureispira sp.]|nr:response regulator transcription factor [Aureispira sp.]
MKVAIIDDEKKARILLRILLEENCPEIEFIEEAEDLPTGVQLIHRFKPDIVFLDIERPGYSGIQLLDFLTLDQITFELIFTTAYSEYAIKAFELNAIDYLLKPLHPEQIEQAVQKVIKKKGQTQLSRRLEELKDSLQSPDFSKIAFPLAEGILFVNFDEIILLVAERMYTKVFTQKDGVIMVSKPLRFFLNTLENVKTFYQPHRSFLINLKYIKKYVTKDGGYILMDNNEMVSITKEKKKELFDILQYG